MNIVTFIISAILLSSLSSIGQAHDERWNLGNATTAGAVLGGVIGYQVDKHDGAVVGAILGAIAGYSHHESAHRQARRVWLDRAEEQRLRRLIRNRIETETQRLVYGGDQLFEPGTSKLRPGSSARLDSLAVKLQQFDRTLVHISGYTDSEATPYHNSILSLGWAEAIAQQLVIRGISRSRIHTVGAGEVASMLNSVGESTITRRVEVFVEPVFDSSDR